MEFAHKEYFTHSLDRAVCVSTSITSDINMKLYKKVFLNLRNNILFY